MDKKQPEQLKFKLADMLDDKDRAILDQFLMPPRKRKAKRKPICRKNNARPGSKS